MSRKMLFQIGGFIAVPLAAVLMVPSALEAQVGPGAGNEAAAQIARQSQLVKVAVEFLQGQARSLRDPKLRQETLDAISNPSTCVRHRAGLTDAAKDQIIQSLVLEGLLVRSDDTRFPGGLVAGIFPPLLDEGTDCPRLPQPFFAAPGSRFHGHHSYPGGLPIHEVNNEVANIHLDEQYQAVYGFETGHGAPRIKLRTAGNAPRSDRIGTDPDLIIGPPIWHDWAKSIVFQWNADGSEFQELSFGGKGDRDNFGQPGDSRTGAHHIIGIAEAMKRGLSPEFVITQACAHSAPASGNEYQVVNWLRAASIIAQIDPVRSGYLTRDSKGDFRLPPVRKLGQVDFLAMSPPQTNFIVEYQLHNLSDADFTFSEPALTMAETLLAQLAPEFGYDMSDITSYNLHYRNPVLSSLTAERLQIIYVSQGLTGIRKQLQILRHAKLIEPRIK